MGEYYIGIDSGTQSTKTIIVDGKNGRVVGTAAKKYGLNKGLPHGYKEQDPKVWLKACAFTIKEAIKSANINARDVLAIGVSGQQHGLVALDQHSQVIRPAKLWCDTSTAPQCLSIMQKLGGQEKVIQLAGNAITPGFTASKILWLKQNEPEHYKRLACILLPHDYINFWLTGKKTMEYGDASGTGLMDVKTRTWCDTMINAIDPQLKSKLPALQSSQLPVGFVQNTLVKKFGFRDDVLVSSGGGDNMMGAIGTGNTRSGIVTASFGTSGTIYAYSEQPVIDPMGEIAAFCDSTNHWLPLLCTLNVTGATEMLRNHYGWSYQDFENAIKHTPIGSDGLLMIPYLEGERTPNIPDGTGVYIGIRPQTFSAPHFARALVEGVTLGMNYGLNRLRTLGIQPEQIRITGGGAQSAAWRQIMADIFECEVIGTQTSEGAAYGGALHAMWCLSLSHGTKIPITEITDRFVKLDKKTSTKPKLKNVAVYKKLQAFQDNAWQNLRTTFAMHHAFIKNE